MEKEYNREVDQIDERLMKKLQVPIICVYDHPSDYPEHFVARLWDLDKPTPIIMMAETLEELQDKKPPRMAALPRFEKDDPCIVEFWI